MSAYQKLPSTHVHHSLMHATKYYDHGDVFSGMNNHNLPWAVCYIQGETNDSCYYQLSL